MNDVAEYTFDPPALYFADSGDYPITKVSIAICEEKDTKGYTGYDLFDQNEECLNEGTVWYSKTVPTQAEVRKFIETGEIP